MWRDSKLWTRSGRTIEAPESFTSQLPAVELDAELCSAGADNFQLASNAARFGARHWSAELRLAVFDCPQAIGTWEQRLDAAGTQLHGSVAFPVEAVRIRGKKHLRALFAAAMEQGLEGLVLRKPNIKGYRTGRVAELVMKLKTEAMLC